MKAVILVEQGSVGNLIQVELPIPTLLADEVLIKVRAIAINPADTYIRKQRTLDYVFNGERPRILGWDISGTIVRVGENTIGFKVSDDVFGLIKYPGRFYPGHAKGYAEYIAAPASDITFKPANISHEEAAAATLAALAAWQSLAKAQIKQGDRLFITAGAGGVGHYAIQIAKYLGAHVIAQSSLEKKDFVLGMGADEHVDYEHQQFITMLEPVDLVLELLRGNHIERSLRIIKPGGTLISLCNYIKGTICEEIARERKVFAWYHAVKSDGSDMEAIAGLLSKGVIRSFVSRTYRLDQIREAHIEMEKDHTKGKIIISLI
ncbi:NADP-dependent oxidoreductase [Chitinophaga agri]|uniref:NADP-dependent oxidoreductase n=1 Tax=Chitinophaga agri TaxID=2703787 RepID=A0A6B9ZBH3_9BACT|nr:NADP-dependent oxidoreductase [Chitinophaga agri]QHS58841.1 NADP-dependent oxidoreductase [Chitinophaga agri]